MLTMHSVEHFKKCMAKAPDGNGKDLRYLAAVFYSTVSLIALILYMYRCRLSCIVGTCRARFAYHNRVFGRLYIDLKGV